MVSNLSPPYDLILDHLLSLFRKADYSYENLNYSKEEVALIDKCFASIEKMTRLRELIFLYHLEIDIKKSDDLEKELIKTLYHIINFKAVAQIHSQSEALPRFMFRISSAATLITIAIILAILLFLPITPLIIVLLSLVIASTLVLSVINIFFLRDELPPLAYIKETIASSKIQLENLTRENIDLLDLLENLVNKLSENQKPDESVGLNDTAYVSIDSIESTINANKSESSYQHDTSLSSSPSPQHCIQESSQSNLFFRSLPLLNIEAATDYGIKHSASCSPPNRFPFWPPSTNTEASNNNTTNDYPLHTSTP